MKVEAAERDRKAVIDTKLAAAKLPEHALTEVFRETLEGAKDEAAIDALIEERQTLLKNATSKVVGTISHERDPKKVVESGGTTPVDESKIGEIDKQLFG